MDVPLLLFLLWDVTGGIPLVSVWDQQIKDFAREFYSSKAWKGCRGAYASSKRGLCEVCLSKGLYVPAEIVHHKIELTPDNIDDPNITLNWNNLQCLCRECHAAAHGSQKRWKVDENGRVTAKF